MTAAPGKAGSAYGGIRVRLGIPDSAVVQNLGWDDDADDLLLDGLGEDGVEIVDDVHDDVVDAVLLWWRDGDGDLADSLLDALTLLDADGLIWLLTPKVGKDGHVDGEDIAEAAPLAGLATTGSLTLPSGWHATKLAPPRRKR